MPLKEFVRLELTSNELAWVGRVDSPNRLSSSYYVDTTSSMCEDVFVRVRKNQEIDAHKNQLSPELSLSAALISESFDRDFHLQTSEQTSVDKRDNSE